jgi:hypothetical protein
MERFDARTKQHDPFHSKALERGMRTTLDLGSWCILCMASADTLKVVEALTRQGLGVWTPVEWEVARMPITRARYDKPTPIIPGYAFGDAGHLDALVRFAGLRLRDMPRFRFLESETCIGHTPLITDCTLQALREEEERRCAVFERAKRRDHKPEKPDLGAEVKMPEGAFSGLSGDVVRTKGRDVVVDIPNCPFTLKVSSLLALESVAKAGLPHGIAA